MYLTNRSSDPRHEAEIEFVTALQAARAGDQRALFDYYMSKGAPESEPYHNSTSSSDVLPSHGGRLEEEDESYPFNGNGVAGGGGGGEGEGIPQWFDGSSTGSDVLLPPPSFPFDSPVPDKKNNNNDYTNNNNDENNEGVLRSS